MQKGTSHDSYSHKILDPARSVVRKWCWRENEDLHFSLLEVPYSTIYTPKNDPRENFLCLFTPITSVNNSSRHDSYRSLARLRYQCFCTDSDHLPRLSVFYLIMSTVLFRNPGSWLSSFCIQSATRHTKIVNSSNTPLTIEYLRSRNAAPLPGSVVLYIILGYLCFYLIELFSVGLPVRAPQYPDNLIRSRNRLDNL
jgi:hypothetical protein